MVFLPRPRPPPRQSGPYLSFNLPYSNAGWSGALTTRSTEPISRFRVTEPLSRFRATEPIRFRTTVGSLSRVTEPRRFRSAGWSAPVSAVMGGRFPCRTSEPHRRFRASGRGLKDIPVSPVQTTYKMEHVDEPMPVSPVQTTYKVEHVDEPMP